VAARLDEDVLKIFRCMRDAGWDLPEPARGEHGAFIFEGMDVNVPRDQLSVFNGDFNACTGTPWLPPESAP
jgi:hypothetical protein